MAGQSYELGTSRVGGESSIGDGSSVGANRTCQGLERAGAMTTGNELDQEEQRLAVLKDLAILNTPLADGRIACPSRLRSQGCSKGCGI